MRVLFAGVGASDTAFEQLLGMAEESGNDAQAASLVRETAGARAMTPVDADDSGYEDVALQAMRRYRALPPPAIAALRERWLQQSSAVRFPAWKQWLYFDASPALTADEARLALAHGDDSTVPYTAGAHANAQLGRVLLLAGRYADAASRLESAAFSCAPIVGDTDSNSIFIIRAARDLGRAREALGDPTGACAAYQRVLDRWGHATPRSTTADEARARFARLGCVAK